MIFYELNFDIQRALNFENLEIRTTVVISAPCDPRVVQSLYIFCISPAFLKTSSSFTFPDEPKRALRYAHASKRDLVQRGRALLFAAYLKINVASASSGMERRKRPN